MKKPAVPVLDDFASYVDYALECKRVGVTPEPNPHSHLPNEPRVQVTPETHSFKPIIAITQTTLLDLLEACLPELDPERPDSASLRGKIELVLESAGRDLDGDIPE